MNCFCPDCERVVMFRAESRNVERYSCTKHLGIGVSSLLALTFGHNAIIPKWPQP